jgi:hypothetical protein
MKNNKRSIFAFFLIFALNAAGARAASPAANAVSSNGGHDFDFLLGTWQTHISYLRTSSADSSRWVNLSGTVTNREIWSGAGDIEQIEANGSSGRFEGMTLRLYDAKTHEWTLYWANSRDGQLQAPITGEFAGSIGTFYDQEAVNGHTAFVRQRYFKTGPDSYRFDEASSTDGGKTWSTDFRAALNRTRTLAAAYAAADSAPPMQHDFDWQFGTWRIQMSRLLHPLSGSAARDQLSGTVVVDKIWNGRANFAKIDAQGKSGSVHILALRLYLPQTAQWSLSFTSEDDGTLSVPMYGTFKDGVGEFYDQEFYHGKAILDRFRFYGVSANSAHDEEAFSQDGGKTWQTNWINVHTRITLSSRACRGKRHETLARSAPPSP